MACSWDRLAAEFAYREEALGQVGRGQGKARGRKRVSRGNATYWSWFERVSFI
jgi:hypothetical protein